MAINLKLTIYYSTLKIENDFETLQKFYFPKMDEKYLSKQKKKLKIDFVL